MSEGNENQSSTWKFDPKTGKPISGAQETAGTAQDFTGAQPGAQPGAAQSGAGKKFPVKIVGIAAVAVVAVAVVGKVFAGGVGMKHGTVVTKTLSKAVFSFEDSRLGQDMNLKKLRTSKTGSIGLDGSFEESLISADVKGTVSYDFGAKKYSVDRSEERRVGKEC